MHADKAFRFPFKSRTLRLFGASLAIVSMLAATAVAGPFILAYGLIKGAAYLVLMSLNLCTECVQNNLEN